MEGKKGEDEVLSVWYSLVQKSRICTALQEVLNHLP